MKIKVLSFGKKTDDFAGDVDRYCKLIRPWAQLDFTYLKSPAGLSGAEQLRREGELLKSTWDRSAVVISLAEEGELFTTRKMACWFETKSLQSQSVIINIGNAYGLSSDVKRESDLLWSLSPLTFPYKICRLVLAEQLYRIFACRAGHPYHKD